MAFVSVMTDLTLTFTVELETGGEEVKSTTTSPLIIPPSTHEFTAEDTIKLDTSQERKDDDLSLIVHVDESQIDLDNDLDSDLQKSELSNSVDTDDKQTDATATIADTANSREEEDDDKAATEDSMEHDQTDKPTAATQQKQEAELEDKEQDVATEGSAAATPTAATTVEAESGAAKEGDKPAVKRLVCIGIRCFLPSCCVTIAATPPDGRCNLCSAQSSVMYTMVVIMRLW